MDKNKQIAIKGDELLWPQPEHVIYADNSVVAVSVLHGTDSELNTIFDPVNYANDMNKLIESLQLDVTWNTGIWTAGNFDLYARAESRDEAIRQCVIKAL